MCNHVLDGISSVHIVCDVGIALHLLCAWNLADFARLLINWGLTALCRFTTSTNSFHAAALVGCKQGSAGVEIARKKLASKPRIVIVAKTSPCKAAMKTIISIDMTNLLSERSIVWTVGHLNIPHATGRQVIFIRVREH